MIKLLLVEDDEACAYAIQGGLEMLEVYELRWAANGKEALDIYESFRPDVVVSDVQMPQMDGFELARIIRENNKQVIILLATGLTSPKDLRDGYNTGIDEYVKKPFIAEELHYRIQAIMNRSRLYTSADSQLVYNKQHIRIGRYVFDTENETLTLNGQVTQELTTRESQLLLLLHQNLNKVVSRQDILHRFWPEDDPVFASRSLDVFISKLRKYLSKEMSVKIVNQRGKGLRLIIE